MIQFTAGVILGIAISAVTAIVGYCIYLEKKYPEIRAQYLSEMEK